MLGRVQVTKPEDGRFRLRGQMMMRIARILSCLTWLLATGATLALSARTLRADVRKVEGCLGSCQIPEECGWPEKACYCMVPEGVCVTGSSNLVAVEPLTGLAHRTQSSQRPNRHGEAR
jgi:hypothetical protein